MAEYRALEGDNEEDDELVKGTTFRDLRRNMRDMIIEKEAEVVSAGNLKMPVFMVRDMDSTFLTMEKALLYVGDNSTFQKRITWILAIQWISFSFMVSSMAYFFRTPSFSCRVPMTEIYFSCTHNTACSLGPDYYRVDPPENAGQVSITQEFGLFCEHSDRISNVQGLFFLGGFVSGYLLSFISQRIGRRPVILGVLMLSVVSLLVCSFAPDQQVFVIGYFFTGCFLFGYETTVYLYISEISAVRFKTISINMLTMVWAGTPMFLPLLGFISTWRYSFLLFAAIWIATLPFAYFCFLESPRFLLSRKRFDQVRAIFRKISQTNRRPPYRFKLMEEMEMENEGYLRFGERIFDSKLHSQVEIKNYNYLDLFRYNSVLKATFLLMLLWTFRFFIYFSTNLALESVLQSGFWLTLVISTSSFAEVIGTFGIPIVTFIFGRRWSSMRIIRACLIAFVVLCGLLFLLNLEGECELSKYDETQSDCISYFGMLLVIIGIKFTSSIFFSAMISFSSQAYPTVVRSLGYGFTLTFGRMSTFMVPFYISFMRMEMEHYNALCWLSPVALLCYCFSYLLPATSQMLSTIPEQDQQLKMERQNRNIEMEIIQTNLRKTMSIKAQQQQEEQNINPRRPVPNQQSDI